MTKDFVDFVLPVTVPHEGEDGVTLACLVDARIAVASEQDAPIVAKWQDWRVRGRNHDFRAWGGRLVGDGYGPASLAQLTQRSKDDWRMLVGAGWYALSSSPWSNWAGQPGGLKEVRFVDDADPAIRLKVEAALKRIAGSVGIDGAVWIPTSGPVAVVGSDHGAVSIRTQGPSYSSRGGVPVDLFRDHWGWSAFDMDGLMAGLEGIGIHVAGGDRPVVISNDGWDIEATIRSHDSEVLREFATRLPMDTMNTPKRKATPESIEALVAMRDQEQHDDERVVAVQRFVDAFEARYVQSWTREAKDARTLSRIVRMLVSRIESRMIVEAPELKGFSA